MQSRQETERRPIAQTSLPHSSPRPDSNRMQVMTGEMCLQQEGPIRDKTRHLTGRRLLNLKDLQHGWGVR
jgi:hypothetical protein